MCRYREYCNSGIQPATVQPPVDQETYLTQYLIYSKAG